MTWHKRFSWLLAGAALAALALSCSAPVPSDCNDGRDNDGDGLIDYADFGCIYTDGAVEADPPQCTDGVDNDGDNAIDLDDPGCDSDLDESEDDPIVECNDGVDNDLDGLVDFPADDGCSGPTDTDEYQPAACSDGEDNDEDGIIDYPLEPGCSLPGDTDETDPFPQAECSDGVDNDEDGSTDFPSDEGCAAAGDNNEFNVVIGACGPTVFIEDITVSGEGVGIIDGPTINELYSEECGGFGGEFAFVYQVADRTALEISTDHPETTLDTVVYVRSGCQAPTTELGCDDDGGVSNSRASVLTLPAVEPGTYYIIVDAFSPGSLGEFKVRVTERDGLGADCDPGVPDACLAGLVCREVMPGAGYTCELPVCSDGVDNDGDNMTDYPEDPGCATPDAPDEQNPNPITECSDGVDNDGDGDIDLMEDDGCESAADDIEDTCGDAAPVVDVTYQAFTTGLTLSAGADHTGSCASTVNAPDIVHRLRVPGRLANLYLSTNGSSFDTVLYMRESSCTGTEYACDNDGGAGPQSNISVTDVAPGDYWIIVDGWNVASGSYDLAISGIIADGEICDPAQLASNVMACDIGSSCVDDGMGVARCL